MTQQQKQVAKAGGVFCHVCSCKQAVNLLGNIEGCWPTGVADSASEGVNTACASHAPSTAGTTHPTLLLQPLAC